MDIGICKNKNNFFLFVWFNMEDSIGGWVGVSFYLVLGNVCYTLIMEIIWNGKHRKHIRQMTLKCEIIDTVVADDEDNVDDADWMDELVTTNG